MDYKERKVKELAERVRLTDEEIREIRFKWGYGRVVCDTDKAMAKAQLNKVLKDDDLALFDRETPRNGYTKFYQVIPLAEIIGDRKENNGS